MSSSVGQTPAPQHCPSPRELDDLELLVSGALAPYVGFNEPGSVVTLELPGGLAGAEQVELVDPEGLPLALVTDGGRQITALTHAQFGAFRELHLTPAQVRERYAGRTFVPVTGPLTTAQLDELAGLGPLVLLTLSGTGTPEMSAVGLVRATVAAAGHLRDAAVVAVPLASHGDAGADHALGLRVVENYAAGDPVRALADAGLDSDDEYPADIAAVVDFDLPEPGRQGLVLFFTGLSGSGKSTLARALIDRLLEQGERTVTSLDGDVVRRNLSAGLTFSKEDRETNIRRIGWVAAEIARHGGVAVCSPIAPFDETRQQVRAMVEAAGGEFFLIHVATPLAECERRDRKGLYAKARRGEIPEFTGISSPYEEPEDAAVRVDTTGRTIPDALDDVLRALAASGHVHLAPASPVDADAEAGTQADEAPLNVLFVCTANICRSAYAEVTARHLLEGAGKTGDILVSSAGTHGFHDHPINPDIAVELATEAARGYFRSRPLSPALIDDADLVLTAETWHRTTVLEEQAQAFRKAFTLAEFAEAVQTLRGQGVTATGRALIAEAASQRPATKPEHDIADPYKRGPVANTEAATRIRELLEIVLPALTEDTPPDRGLEA